MRLCSDPDGETHFEGVHLTAALKRHGSGAQTAVAPLVPVEGLIFRRVVDPAISEGPHDAPYPVFIVTLAGAAEVTVSDGETRTFEPGAAVLVEDTTGKGHTTRDAPHRPANQYVSGYGSRGKPDTMRKGQAMRAAPLFTTEAEATAEAAVRAMPAWGLRRGADAPGGAR